MVSRAGAALRAARALVAVTVALCLRHRVTGLAAEAGFFGLLSLPPLVLGLAASAAWVGQSVGVSVTASLRSAVEDAVSPLLTQEAVDQVILPTLADALGRPRVDLISVGFALSVWSGSRALNVYVDTIAIMSGLGGHRGIVRTRALSLSLYVLTLVVGSVAVPIGLVGPTVVAGWLPPRLLWVLDLAWPASLVGAVVLLAALYHVATPVRSRWLRTLPGAALALGLWVLASWVLRVWLAGSIGGTSVYGPLTAAILVLIWLYFLAFAVLVGAGLNAASQQLWPTPGSDGAPAAEERAEGVEEGGPSGPVGPSRPAGPQDADERLTPAGRGPGPSGARRAPRPPGPGRS